MSCRILSAAGLLLLSVPGVVLAGKPDPAKELAEARALQSKGRHAKAAAAFGRAADASEDGCTPCRVEQVRAFVAAGLLDDAAQVARLLTRPLRSVTAAEGENGENGGAEAAVLDEGTEAAPAVATATDGHEAKSATRVDEDTLAEFATLFTAHLDDPAALPGVFDLFTTLGRYDEVARLAVERLGGGDFAQRALLCAADPRDILDPRADDPPAVAALNERLRAQGWKGPFLFTRDMVPPKQRTKNYFAVRPNAAEAGEEIDGYAFVGAVDLKGRLQGVRRSAPAPEKEARDEEKKVRSTYFDAATLRGRRLEVCYPTVAGARPDTKRDKSYPIDLTGFHGIIQDLKTVEEIIALVEKAGPDAPEDQRDAICAVTESRAEINRKLGEMGWPGPFLDTVDIEDPVPVSTPPPEYTETARKAGAEGTVKAVAVIDENGKVRSVVPFRGLPGGMTAAAIMAMESWTYEPATRDGKPLPVCALLEVSLPPKGSEAKQAD